MPTARRTRTIDADPQRLWLIVSDPHHLPRWWPRVERVEDVRDGAFTEVMRSSRGRVVRADFDVLASDAQRGRVRWAQRLEGTAFAGVLRSAETEIALAPAPGESEGAPAPARTAVTIELRQALAGPLARLGGLLVRRAARATLEEALAGLERIGG